MKIQTHYLDSFFFHLFTHKFCSLSFSLVSVFYIQLNCLFWILSLELWSFVGDLDNSLLFFFYIFFLYYCLVVVVAVVVAVALAAVCCLFSCFISKTYLFKTLCCLFHNENDQLHLLSFSLFFFFALDS